MKTNTLLSNRIDKMNLPDLRVLNSSYAFPRHDRYAAKNILKPVTFICRENQAAQVSLIGDFNNWQVGSHPMERQLDGSWRIQVSLSHGTHHYLFYVDGVSKLDPRAMGIARNEKNEKMSMISVS